MQPEKNERAGESLLGLNELQIGNDLLTADARVEHLIAVLDVIPGETLLAFTQHDRREKPGISSKLLRQYLPHLFPVVGGTVFQAAPASANAVADERVRDFYPSLYLNLGHSYEMVGNQAEAQRYFNLAAELGFVHSQTEFLKNSEKAQQGNQNTNNDKKN